MLLVLKLSEAQPTSTQSSLRSLISFLADMDDIRYNLIYSLNNNSW